MNQSIESELIALENKYWQAIKDKDVNTLLEMTDNPCFVTGAQGVGEIDQQSFAKMMESANYTLEKFELTQAKVRLLNENVAILAYKVNEELTVDGEFVKLEASDASTWVRRDDGRWVCSLHTESLTGDPYGRDRRAEKTL